MVFKRCFNPECKKEILEYKSSKKIYCNNQCRNRAGYINRSIENKDLIAFTKGLDKNKKLLKQFIDAGLKIIPFEIIHKLGFNTSFLPNGFYAKFNFKEIYVFKINSIVFNLDNDNKNIIIYQY